jgi:septal ring factor EnvC (AmiA/AmiB activator)
MRSLIQITTFSALVAFGLAPTPRATAAVSGDQAKEVMAKIEGVRTGCTKIRNQVGLTLEELNRLQVDSVELRPQFERFTAELVKMEDQAKMARDRAGSMSEKGEAFFNAWEGQIKTIANEDIRNQAQKRYDKRLKSYDKIVKAMLEARDELVPFLSDLNDIKKLLDSELSSGSVKAAKQTIKTANWHGSDVADSLKDVESELDRVSAELAKYK